MAGAFLHAILFSCGLLAVGLALRAKLRLMRLLYIPASVIAGAIGLVLVQAGLRLGAADVVKPVSSELAGWPSWLIAIVFAALLLERSSGKGFVEAIRRGARSGVLAWIIILGQILIGLVVYLLVVKPYHPQIPAVFGQLLEVSWAGGHGSSAAMGDVYAALEFGQGKDLAFLLATTGLVYGVLSGLVLVNLAIRRGWVRGGGVQRVQSVTGLEPRHNSPPVAFAKTRPEVLEPLALQAIILAAAFGMGYLLQQLFIGGAELVLGANNPAIKGEPIDFAMNVPLFLFTLLGGLLVREAMRLLRIDDLIDSASLHRLVGLAMEFLIVAAIATIRIEAVQTFLLPILLLVLLAGAWSAFCLLVLARRLLPQAYWFELGLLNYGFSTANTPQGLMLLRIVDPDLQSGAAEDYAVAAPLSAPFVGGGVITIVVLPLILQQTGAAVVAAAVALLIAGFILLGSLLSRRAPASRAPAQAVQAPASDAAG